MLPRLSSGGSQPGVVVGHRTPVGQQLAVVVEQDDAVAQQPPALLGVAADHDGEIAGVAVGVGTRSPVLAHGDPPLDPAWDAGPTLQFTSVSQRQIRGETEAVPVIQVTGSPGRGSGLGEMGRAQSLRSSTRRTEWSAAFCSTSLARERVGAMFSRRFGPLTADQMSSAVVRACSSVRSANRWKYAEVSAKAVRRSARKRSTYQRRMSASAAST